MALRALTKIGKARSGEKMHPRSDTSVKDQRGTKRAIYRVFS